MKITHLTATELKRKTGEILNLVAYGGTIAIVERHGEPLVKIEPAKMEDEGNLEEKIKKYFGTIPHFPAVYKNRYFRGRKFSL